MAVYSAKVSTYSDGETINASLFNNEFNQIVAVFEKDSGHTHDDVQGDGGPITKLRGQTLTFGTTGSASDVAITFTTSGNTGVLTWDQSEDYFKFSDDVLIDSTEKLQFRDTAIYINSSTDGQLDIVADTEIQIAATTVDINGTVNVSGQNIVFGDSSGASDDRLVFGDGSDLQIYHDGSHSYILQPQSGTGDLIIQAQNIKFRNDNDEVMLIADDNNVGLYFDGTSKLATTSSGINVSGTIIADGLTLGDNESINLNTDLEIKSSGGLSEIIETGSGNLVVKAADLSLNDSNNFRRVYCTDGASGAVQLYFGDTSSTGSKLNTTNTGVNITGTLNADALTIDGNADINGAASIAGAITDVTVLTVDNIQIDGTTIGHTSDTDLITLASNQVTVAGKIESSSLDIGSSTEVSSIKDEDNMSSNSATALATQQSIKAYVDSQIDTVDTLSEILTLSSNETGGQNLKFGDSSGTSDDRLQFGNTPDFLIFYSGTTSIIDGRVGGNVNIFGGDAVQLHHGSNQKLATSSTGITVTGTAVATAFTGDLTGDVTGNVSGSSGSCTGNAATATTATNVVVTDNESTNENNAITFVANADIDGSTSAGLESDGNLTYNPSTGTLTATTFSGALSGNATTASNVMSTSINSTGQNIQTSTNNTRFIHTGGAVNFAVADETYNASAIERWVVINAGSADITFTRTNATFTKLEVNDVTSSATSCKLKKGGVCEIVLTATNTFTIFGSGVE